VADGILQNKGATSSSIVDKASGEHGELKALINDLAVCRLGRTTRPKFAATHGTFNFIC